MTNFRLTTPIVGSLRKLEFLLGLKREALHEILRSRDLLYCSFDVPKKNHPYPGKKRIAKARTGSPKSRHIDNPSKQLKDIQTRILKNILSGVILPEYMFGAIRGKNIVSHAKLHVRNQTATVVHVDIGSFYPSVKCAHVYRVWNSVLACPPRIARLLTGLTTFNGHLPQGAPTSAALANLFLASIYGPVFASSKRLGVTASTWVDDLVFSGEEARELIEEVRSLLAHNRLRLAPEKREILGERDEKLVTGARLGRKDVRAPHRVMSELRSAIHILASGLVRPDGLETYRRNLIGRVMHVRSVCKRDGDYLIRLASQKGVKLIGGVAHI